MNSQIRKNTVPFGALVAAVFFLIVAIFISVSSNTFALNKNSTTDGRLVTIYDRGTEKTILTQALTIGDAIKEAGILIDANDAVEPSVDTTMVSTNYQVNIYRARPVTIIDGNIRQRIMTPYQTAEQIAKAAEITLYPEDTTDISVVENLIDGAGLQLTIHRAASVNFTLYGKTTIVRTQAATVGDMLKEKGINLGDSDHTSVSLDAKITDGMLLRVWREGKQTITVDETISFDTETIDSADQPVGYHEVRSAGILGKKNVTYEITIQDGKESSRVEIARIIKEQPTKQIEVIGTKVTTPEDARVLGHKMMLDYGFSEDQWTCLDSLWYRESRWSLTATNSTSGAYGIPQSLPASKMATAGSDYLTNAATQISWGLKYIKDRYATPCGAWNKSESVGWY